MFELTDKLIPTSPLQRGQITWWKFKNGREIEYILSHFFLGIAGDVDGEFKKEDAIQGQRKSDGWRKIKCRGACFNPALLQAERCFINPNFKKHFFKPNPDIAHHFPHVLIGKSHTLVPYASPIASPIRESRFFLRVFSSIYLLCIEVLTSFFPTLPSQNFFSKNLHLKTVHLKTTWNFFSSVLHPSCLQTFRGAWKKSIVVLPSFNHDSLFA